MRPTYNALLYVYIVDIVQALCMCNSVKSMKQKFPWTVNWGYDGIFQSSKLCRMLLGQFFKAKKVKPDRKHRYFGELSWFHIFFSFTIENVQLAKFIDSVIEHSLDAFELLRLFKYQHWTPTKHSNDFMHFYVHIPVLSHFFFVIAFFLSLPSVISFIYRVAFPIPI